MSGQIDWQLVSDTKVERQHGVEQKGRRELQARAATGFNYFTPRLSARSNPSTENQEVLSAQIRKLLAAPELRWAAILFP